MIAVSGMVACTGEYSVNGTYVYSGTGLSDKPWRIRITYDTNQMTFSSGDTIVSMRSCPLGYKCLRGGSKNFVLPSNWQVASHWNFDGIEFHVIGMKDFSFHGHPEAVW